MQHGRYGMPQVVETSKAVGGRQADQSSDIRNKVGIVITLGYFLPSGIAFVTRQGGGSPGIRI